MVWRVKEIAEADFGCEERMPGEPLMVLVTIECEDGRAEQLEVADSWLVIHNINEGDEWPEDIEKIEEEEMKINNMSAWMNNYLDAVEEMDDTYPEE